MTGTPKHKLYEAARTMFIEHGTTCAAIADTLGLHESRLSEWRNKMKWDDDRRRLLSTPDTIKKLLLEDLERVANGQPAQTDVKALCKLKNALEYFDGKVSFSVVLAVIRELDNFIAETDPQKALEHTDCHKQFLAHRAKLDSLK